MVESLIFIVLGVLVIVFLMQLHFNAIAGRIAPLSRLEAKVDLLLKNANIKYDRPPTWRPTSPRRRGAKIEAIKLYREQTGVGLKEAKDFVERLQSQTGVM